MDSEAPKEQPRHGSSLFSVFITSFCAAIVMAGGFGIVFEAFTIAAANLFALGHMFVLIGQRLQRRRDAVAGRLDLRALLARRAAVEGGSGGRRA